jgi:hypothetical protein
LKAKSLLGLDFLFYQLAKGLSLRGGTHGFLSGSSGRWFSLVTIARFEITAERTINKKQRLCFRGQLPPGMILVVGGGIKCPGSQMPNSAAIM